MERDINRSVIKYRTIFLGQMRRLTVHVVDLQPSQVFGSPVLRGREEGWVMEWEISVVILQNGQSSLLDAV